MFIRILQVAGFHPAVQAMRLPLDSGDRSDTNLDASYSGIGPKDMELSLVVDLATEQLRTKYAGGWEA